MATIKGFIDQFTGQPEQQKKAEDEVQVLVQLATYKLESLENELKNMFRNKELEGQLQIVGDRMGEFIQDYRVDYEVGDVSAAVSDIVNTIMDLGSEDARKIIAKTINNALKAFFSQTAVTEGQRKLFVVGFESVAMIRYDFYVWKYRSQSNGLFTTTKSVVAFTYCRSVIDHEKVSEDELNDAINRSFGGHLSPEELGKYRDSLDQLWKRDLKRIPSEVSMAEYANLRGSRR